MKFGPAHISAALGLAAIVVAAFAQHSYIFSKEENRALFLFPIAVALFATALAVHRDRIPLHLNEPTAPARSGRKVSPSLQVGAVVAALLTFLLSSDNEFTSDNVLAWIVSVTLFFYAFWEPQKTTSEWRDWTRAQGESLRRIAAQGLHIPTRTLTLSAIILLGILFYYNNLAGVPAEPTSDHAEKLLDVHDVAARGLRPIFFERNTGREPLQFYLTALWIGLSGNPINHTALKVITALMGVLVIPGTYFLARELFSDEVALTAAGLIAISKWPLAIARMGLRFPFTAVFLAPAVYFLFRALKRNSRNDFMLAGLFVGIGLHGYNAFRAVPLVLIAFVLLWLWTNRVNEREKIQRYLTNVGLMFGLVLMILMPLLRYSIDRPGQIWYRAMTRVTAVEQEIAGSPLQVLGSNMLNALLMFNWTGDEAWPNNIPGDPALDYVSGGLFLLGCVYALYRLVFHREWAYAYVTLGLVIMLLPSALSLAFPRENPSIVRAGGAIPFVFILIALPLVWLKRTLERATTRLLPIAVFLGIFVFIAHLNYVRYFVDFDQKYRELSWNSSEVASVIRGFTRSIGDVNRAYIVLWPHWIDTRNVAINMGQIGWDQTIPNADSVEHLASDPANKLFILNPKDEDNLVRLREIFPNTQTRFYYSRTPGREFIILYAPGTAAPDARLGAE